MSYKDTLDSKIGSAGDMPESALVGEGSPEGWVV
jgi:hypothetical protein